MSVSSRLWHSIGIVRCILERNLFLAAELEEAEEPAKFVLSIPFANNSVAADTAKEFENIPLPGQTQYIEKVSVAGKLVRNGNGMQYFFALFSGEGER